MHAFSVFANNNPYFKKLSKRPNKKKSPKNINPLKKYIMERFDIKEIDYKKFKEESKWAIRIDKLEDIEK